MDTLPSSDITIELTTLGYPLNTTPVIMAVLKVGPPKAVHTILPVVQTRTEATEPGIRSPLTPEAPSPTVTRSETGRSPSGRVLVSPVHTLKLADLVGHTLPKTQTEPILAIRPILVTSCSPGDVRLQDRLQANKTDGLEIWSWSDRLSKAGIGSSVPELPPLVGPGSGSLSSITLTV